MTYQEALNYIHDAAAPGSKPGLERIEALMKGLGSPEKKMKYIHIAGTNGKGSCAAMTASVLKCCGYKTGLFTSPYLYRFNERMQINGKPIDDEVLGELVERLKPVVEKMEDKPTEFELMTAAALLWYAEEHCDYVVLEVGLGGRFDSTNIIPAPVAAVIMNIGLDHTEILGDTPEKIAFEKAGIIKPGCDCVLYEQSEEVMAVVRKACEERDARLHIADFSAIRSDFDSVEGQAFTYKGEPYALPLLGAHQLRNAAVVLELVEVLRRRGAKLEQSDVEHGMYAVSWPGRFEVLSDEPWFVVDGGHNPQCAETVRENLHRYFPEQKHILLVGVLGDKDYEGLFRILNEEADAFVCVTPDSPRALPADRLAEHLSRYGKPVQVCASVEEGVAAAQEAAGMDGMVCAVGSLYMVGDVRICFGLR